MRYKAKSIAALNIALGGLPAQMPGRGGLRHRNIGKDRRRASPSNRMA